MVTAEGKSKRGLFPRRGYLLLMVGILIGFLIFVMISLMFLRIAPQTIVGIPEEIQFEFLYTSEKQGWIEEVTPEFEKWFFESFGIRAKVVLVGPHGSHETVNYILHGIERPTVWSPASNIWIPYLNTKWHALGHETDIASEWASLVISPVVIAGWKSFVDAYNVSGFEDLYELAIRGVDYKYGHTDPLLSNSGAMITILEFAEAANKSPEHLTVNDFKNETIINFVRTIESKAVLYGKSTGFFGKWAVESGPSAISFFGVYENVVIDYSREAVIRHGDPIVAIYPKSGTLLSDHPFVILHAEWVDPWERFAASQYFLYLLSPEVQEKAQKHGFRPANPSVPLNGTIFNETNGVQLEFKGTVFRPLSGEAFEALFDAWPNVKKP